MYPAKELWDTIASANNWFAGLLEQLDAEAKLDSAYSTHLESCAQTNASEVSTHHSTDLALKLKPTQWATAGSKVETLLYEIRKTAQEIRAGMRTMGELADVPIEPKEQTALLDACIGIPGVVCGGVPGGTSPVLATGISHSILIGTYFVIFKITAFN